MESNILRICWLRPSCKTTSYQALVFVSPVRVICAGAVRAHLHHGNRPAGGVGDLRHGEAFGDEQREDELIFGVEAREEF